MQLTLYLPETLKHVLYFRIHYPLPLPYVGKPDPRQLQEQVRNLREEIKSLKIKVQEKANIC